MVHLAEDTENVIGKLREIAHLMSNNDTISQNDLRTAQKIAARLYLKHAKRTITLSKDEFDNLIDILKTKI